MFGRRSRWRERKWAGKTESKMAEWSAEIEVVAKGGRGGVVETADPLVCKTAALMDLRLVDETVVAMDP